MCALIRITMCSFHEDESLCEYYFRDSLVACIAVRYMYTPDSVSLALLARQTIVSHRRVFIILLFLWQVEVAIVYS